MRRLHEAGIRKEEMEATLRKLPMVLTPSSRAALWRTRFALSRRARCECSTLV
jgi:hypothetical protein